MNRQTLLRCGMLLASALAVLVAGTAARGDAYQDIVTYTWDQPRTAPASIEEDIRAAATPAAQKAIEVKLIKALSSPQATYECKQFVCRMLRPMGSAACVPALAKLLPDEKLSHMARFALQGMACEQAGDALRQAMDRLDGALKLGMISSVGQRHDAKAVPSLAKYAASDLDPDLVIAAIGALGHIATPEAAKVLAGLKVPRMLATWYADARLCCADAMLAGGNAAEAAAIYKAMFAEGQTKPIRVAALRGLVMAQKEAAVATLVGLLKSPDVDFTRAATQFLIEMPGAAATKAIAGQLAAASPEAQVALMDILSARADTAAAPQVTALTDSKDETVRLAALRALAVLGDVSSVPVLAKAASAGGKVGEVAIDSLNRLRGEGVGEAMGKLLDSPDPVIRAGILGVMTVRNDKTMAPAMVKAAGNADAGIRKTAIAGLAALAGEKELPDIVALLVATKDEAERSALERALASAAGRAGSPDAAAAPIVDGLAKADAVAKVPLLTVLGEVGGAKALAGVRGQMAADADVATAAVRALQAWPDAAPAEDLLGVIKTTKNNTQKVLAFRGYVRMANMPSGRPAAETMKMYEQALALATTAAEKKSVLAGLAGARSVGALALVEKLMADADLKAEAEAAYVQVAGNVRDVAPDEARAALKKVVAETANAGLRQQAQAALTDMDKYAGYVSSWLGSGPYTEGDGFDTAYAPEKDGGKDAKWQVMTKGVGPQVIDLEQAISTGDSRVAYARTRLWSAADQDVQLQMGSDDGIKVWVNGQVVHANNATRACQVDEDKAKARLKKGWNDVLVKITQGGGQWAFSFRVVKPDGSAIDGMKVSVDGQ